MLCYYMVHMAAVIGSIIFACGLVMLFAGLTNCRRLTLTVSLLGFALVAEAGWVIGPCINAMMLCHRFTQPVLLLTGAVIAAVGLVDWWRLTRLPGK